MGRREGHRELTVRFTHRQGVIRIIGAGYWRKGSMNRKISYANEPLGDIEVIADFLPPPAALAFREEGVKVTLALSRKSVDFFKSEAAKHSTQYQRMIRRLLDAYVDAQPASPPGADAPKRQPRKRAGVQG